MHLSTPGKANKNGPRARNDTIRRCSVSEVAFEICLSSYRRNSGMKIKLEKSEVQTRGDKELIDITP